MSRLDPSTWPLLRRLSKTDRIVAVMIIATAFFLAEIVVGFRNKSLALVGDAFHISSDIIAYGVALIATRMGQTRDGKIVPAKFSFGYQRAELLGGLFNGAFLMALGVSIVLQSIERFINPMEILDPILVIIIGAAGIGSNVLMMLIMGGHTRDRASTDPLAGGSSTDLHAGHAHSRRADKLSRHGRDLNVLGIFIHILGDALNSIAVMISAGIFMATGFIYVDPIASTFIGLMIISTSYPLLKRCGVFLLETAPESLDLAGVVEDVERITGKDTVHEMHVWSLTQKKALATMHLSVEYDKVSDFMSIAEKVRNCLHFWNIHIATIQPEIGSPSGRLSDFSQTAPVAADTNIDTTPTGLTSNNQLTHRLMTCMVKCHVQCREDVCCGVE